MSEEEYTAAIADGRRVRYHEDYCDAPKSLGYSPCNCGAVEEARKLAQVYR